MTTRRHYFACVTGEDGRSYECRLDVVEAEIVVRLDTGRPAEEDEWHGVEDFPEAMLREEDLARLLWESAEQEERTEEICGRDA